MNRMIVRNSRPGKEIANLKMEAAPARHTPAPEFAAAAAPFRA